MDGAPAMTLDAHHDEIVREARVAGLGRSGDPSLDAVAGRRLQLWGVTSVVVVAMAMAVVASLGERLPSALSFPPGVMRSSVVALAVVFCAYAIEKEVHLRRLTTLLVEEAMRNVALQAEVDRLVEVDRIRSDLLTGVRHDLATPLESILGAAGLLRRELPAAQRASLAGVIERHGTQLRRMVEELVDASRLEREGPPLDLETVDLAGLVRSVAGDFARAGRPVALETSAVPANVRAGEDGLHRIVENLIDNAYRHGDPPVRVTVRADGGEVVLSVRDSGPGIAPQERRRVFELFSRLDPSRAAPGLGLGLAIVPGLVAAWGGRVWVDDAPEGGAAFHVALPRA
jgi:signal transduction histidine kinase